MKLKRRIFDGGYCNNSCISWFAIPLRNQGPEKKWAHVADHRSSLFIRAWAPPLGKQDTFHTVSQSKNMLNYWSIKCYSTLKYTNVASQPDGVAIQMPDLTGLVIRSVMVQTYCKTGNFHLQENFVKFADWQKFSVTKCVLQYHLVTFGANGPSGLGMTTCD